MRITRPRQMVFMAVVIVLVLVTTVTNMSVITMDMIYSE